MNPKNKKTISLLVPIDTPITGKDLKAALKAMIVLFKKAIEIDAFSNLVSEAEANSVDLVEQVI